MDVQSFWKNRPVLSGGLVVGGAFALWLGLRAAGIVGPATPPPPGPSSETGADSGQSGDHSVKASERSVFRQFQVFGDQKEPVAASQLKGAVTLVRDGNKAERAAAITLLGAYSNRYDTDARRVAMESALEAMNDKERVIRVRATQSLKQLTGWTFSIYDVDASSADRKKSIARIRSQLFASAANAGRL